MGLAPGVEFMKLLIIILWSFLREGCIVLTRLTWKDLFTLSIRHIIQNINFQKFERSFVITADRVIKQLSLILYRSKLECLSLSVIITKVSCSLPERPNSKGRLIALSKNSRQGWKWLMARNTLAYYGTELITAEKVLQHRGQCYKTFYGRSLRIFVINLSVSSFASLSNLV